MIRAFAIALTLCLSLWGEVQALDRKKLDACEAKLSALYETCKREHTPRECSRAITTRLCGFTWNEDFGAFQDRRIEESAAPGMSHVFVGLTRLKPSYAAAGVK